MRDPDILLCEARIDLEAAANSLTDKQRQAFVLWVEGYTQAEIAAMCGIAQQQVSSRISRGIARIQSQIK